jgi:hypothetical protein
MASPVIIWHMIIFVQIVHAIDFDNKFSARQARAFRQACRAQDLEDYAVFRKYHFARRNGVIVESGAMVY